MMVNTKRGHAELIIVMAEFTVSDQAEATIIA